MGLIWLQLVSDIMHDSSKNIDPYSGAFFNRLAFRCFESNL